MILYRPVGLQELELIYDSGMKAFPARLPKQPIFYPVLDLDYARETAAGWNAKSGQSAGYVTQFKVEDEYIQRFEKHTVGNSQHEEYWIPAEEVEEFNKHILGHIKVVEAHFGKKFEGFVPDKFGLQGQNAVEQFTTLANSYVYKRMDFYLEIKRNHKAVFVNYPFWQKHEFKNPGLKAKVIQAIKEGWLTAFPNNPLITIVSEDAAPAKSKSPEIAVTSTEETRPPATPIDPKPRVGPRADTTIAKRSELPSPKPSVPKNAPPTKPINVPSFVVSQDEDQSTEEQSDSESFEDLVDEDTTPAQQTISPSYEDLPDEEEEPTEPSSPEIPAHVVRDVPAPFERTAPPTSTSLLPERIPSVKQTVSDFAQGVELGQSGKIDEAIEALSRVVQANPQQVVAQTSLGVLFLRSGQEDRALACYEAALKIDPAYAEAHYFRANILNSHGNLREAIAGYTIAIGLSPDLIDAHQRSAPQDRLTDYRPSPAQIQRIARPARRILALNQSLEANPRQANLFKERAAEFYRLWNYEQAVADYSSSLEIQPNDADALHLRGVAYEQIGQFKRAQEDYRQAVIVDPQLAARYLERGVTFGSTGNFRQSVASLTEGIRLAPRNPDGYFNRGTSYVQLGDFEHAIQDFSMVLQLSPNDEAAFYWRGVSHEEAGHKEEAVADYRQFLALSQDPRARQDVERRLKQWNGGRQGQASIREFFTSGQQKPAPAQTEEPQWTLDLYDLIVALGERALSSTWLGSGVNCYGEKADELLALIDRNQPIPGQDLLHITSGIRQTTEGDFQAFDPGATAHWIFIRAWNGSGFYVEVNDPNNRDRLKTHFQAVEDVEGAVPPYESLFIPI